MRKPSLILSLVVAIAGCSIYRSEGRKQFEGKSYSSIMSYKNPGCVSTSSWSEFWNSQQPNSQSELVYSDKQSELWIERLPAGEVLAHAYLTDDSGQRVCTTTFQSEQEWQDSQDTFISAWSESE